MLSSTRKRRLVPFNSPKASLKDVRISAETVLLFTKEDDTRTEKNIVRVGEVPFRIYKNEYDQDPASDWPAHSSCVVRQGDPGAASFDKAVDPSRRRYGIRHLAPTRLPNSCRLRFRRQKKLPPHRRMIRTLAETERTSNSGQDTFTLFCSTHALYDAF